MGFAKGGFANPLIGRIFFIWGSFEFCFGGVLEMMLDDLVQEAALSMSHLECFVAYPVYTR